MTINARLRVYMPVLAALLIITLLGFYSFWPRKQAVTLRITAGDVLGRRHQIASVLGELATKEKITFEFIPTTGSKVALDKVARGELDLALIQGGLEAPEEVQQVALIYPEPLHILVRESLGIRSLPELQARTLNLSTEGSGTRLLAQEVLKFAGIELAKCTLSDLSYEELLLMPEEQLPDALFMVQSLPSAIVTQFVAEKGYTLLPVEFGESLRYEDIAIVETHIPPLMYSVERRIPGEQLPTVGAYLTLVAHRDIPAESIFRLLTVLFDPEFSRRAKTPLLQEEHLEVFSPYPLHEGARQFLRRNDPLLQVDMLEGLENARSFFFSVIIALFLLRTWIKQQRSHSFEPFLLQVTAIEEELMHSEKDGGVTEERLAELRQNLSRIKGDVVQRYVDGKLNGIELMTGFLTHVNDVRNYLHTMQRKVQTEQLVEEAQEEGETASS
jgi:TRAP transporter TAXI family solute receptor